MLRVKYIYDYSFRLVNKMDGPQIVKIKSPVACLVSDGENFGLSTCCNGSYWRDSDSFCKTRAKEIAIGRMLNTDVLKIPNRKLTSPHGKKTNLLDEVNFWMSRMATQKV
jgi:hypothetical protein